MKRERKKGRGEGRGKKKRKERKNEKGEKDWKKERKSERASENVWRHAKRKSLTATGGRVFPDNPHNYKNDQPHSKVVKKAKKYA